MLTLLTMKKQLSFLAIFCLLFAFLCSGCGGETEQNNGESYINSSGEEASVTEVSSEPEKPFTSPAYNDLSRSLYAYLEKRGVFENCSPEQTYWYTPEDMMMAVYGYHKGYAVCQWVGGENLQDGPIKRDLGGYVFSALIYSPKGSELGIYLVSESETLSLEEAFAQDKIDIARVSEMLPSDMKGIMPEGAEPIPYSELEQPNYHSLSQSLYDHMVEEELYHGDIIYRDNMHLEMLCTLNGYTLVHWGELDYLHAHSRLTYGAYTFTTPQMGGPGGGGLYMIKGDEVMHLEQAYETGVIDITEVYRLVPQHFRYEDENSTPGA